MYDAGNSSWIKHSDFLILDIVFVEVSYLISYFLRFDIYADWPDAYTRIGFLLLLLDVVVAFLGESYTGILKRTTLQEAWAVFKHVSAIMMLCLLYLFCVKETAVYSRIVIGQTWLIALVILYISRELRKKVVRKEKIENQDVQNIVLVVNSKSVREIVESFSKQYGMTICSILIKDIEEQQQEFMGIPVLHHTDEALEYMRTNVVDSIFLHVTEKEEFDEKLLKKCAETGIAIHIHTADLSKCGRELRSEEIAGYSVLTSCIHLADPRQLFVKRMFDIAGSVIGLCITGILWFLFAPIIFFQSPGPIFFSQVRIGKNGRKFKMYKFRTMYLGAEEQKKKLIAHNKMSGQIFKMENDPRVFPIGRFLRKTSLDEFPQMWNVLKGEMSLVGTRPPTIDEYEQYELRHKRRIAVKPGITGLWQVSGRSDILDFEEIVKLDTKYVTEWSIFEDFKILCKTIRVVLKREGSL